MKRITDEKTEELRKTIGDFLKNPGAFPEMQKAFCAHLNESDRGRKLLKEARDHIDSNEGSGARTPEICQRIDALLNEEPT